MISNFQNQRKAKAGSCLSAADVAAFPTRTMPRSQLEHALSSIREDDPDFKAVFALVHAYTTTMMALHQAGMTDELEFVQNPTFQLVKDLSAALLPEFITDLEFSYKSRDTTTTTTTSTTTTSTSTTTTSTTTTTIPIRYSTQLDCIDTTSLEINGETDLCIRFCYVPVFVLEVKDLTMTCDTPEETGEVLAETKGFAEDYAWRMTVPPLKFPSLLISGKVFVFVRRIVADKNKEAVYLLCKPIETFCNDDDDYHHRYSLLEENIKLVSKEIVSMFENIRSLILAVVQKNLEQYSLSRWRCVAVSGNKEDEGGEVVGGGDQRPGHHHSKNKSLPTPNASSTDSCGGTTKISTNQSLLTVRNLQKHTQRLLYK